MKKLQNNEFFKLIISFSEFYGRIKPLILNIKYLIYDSKIIIQRYSLSIIVAYMYEVMDCSTTFSGKYIC
jgi:hypothetical protein